MILDKWIRGYIEENDNRGVTIPKGHTIDNHLFKFEELNCKHIGMYCKEQYIILDIDGCNKNDNGEYDNLDNANTVRKLVKQYCKNAIMITTTHGGVNLIFKRQKRKQYKQSEYTSYGGFCVEYKPSNGKVSIQRDGKMRDIEIIGNPQGEDVDELPLWLQPFYNLDWSNDYKGSLANAKPDNGYSIDNFMHKLASYAKLSTDERKYLINFINNNVLNKPLDNIEKFYNQSSKETVKQEKDDIGTICDSLLLEYDVIMSNDKLYYYNGEVYKPFDKVARKYIGMHSSDKRNSFKNDCLTNLRDVMDNWKFHEYDADDSRYGVDLYDWIATKSELVNIKTLERKPFTKDLFLRKQLCFDIPSHSEPNMVDEITNMLLTNNELDIKLWWEYQGYLLMRTVNFEKMLTLNGGGSNGKSVLLDLATYALQGCCQKFAFKNLFAKFGGLQLENNWFVYGHEMTSQFQKDASNFKESISNNDRDIEPKGKDYIQLQNYNCKFMYANNGVTNMEPSSAEAIIRRQLPLLFEHHIADEDKEEDFYERWLVPENAERYLYLAVKHGQDLLKREHFVLSERSKRELLNYAHTIDSVKQWLDNGDYEIKAVEPKEDLFTIYYAWCKNNNYKPLNSDGFGKRLMKYKPFTTTKAICKDGKRKNAYSFV